MQEEKHVYRVEWWDDYLGIWIYDSQDEYDSLMDASEVLMFSYYKGRIIDTKTNEVVWPV